MGSPESDRYYTHLPVRTGGNHFFNGASPCRKEKNGQVHENVDIQKFEKITSETLGIAFEPEMRYENPDGSSITF